MSAPDDVSENSPIRVIDIDEFDPFALLRESESVENFDPCQPFRLVERNGQGEVVSERVVNRPAPEMAPPPANLPYIK